MEKIRRLLRGGVGPKASVGEKVKSHSGVRNWLKKTYKIPMP